MVIRSVISYDHTTSRSIWYFMIIPLVIPCGHTISHTIWSNHWPYHIIIPLVIPYDHTISLLTYNFPPRIHTQKPAEGVNHTAHVSCRQNNHAVIKLCHCIVLFKANWFLHLLESPTVFYASGLTLSILWVCNQAQKYFNVSVSL